VSWPLRLVDLEALRAQGKYPRPGDCWYAPWLSEGWSSPEYIRDHLGKRHPLVVCVPGGFDWCVDGPANNLGGHGWTVTGEAPRLTATPSIGTEKYHGWLRDGVLSDDLEGRTYPEVFR
jgi:hypothetical protein